MIFLNALAFYRVNDFEHIGKYLYQNAIFYCFLGDKNRSKRACFMIFKMRFSFKTKFKA